MFHIDINCMETPIFKPEKGPKSEENDPAIRRQATGQRRENFRIDVQQFWIILLNLPSNSTLNGAQSKV